MENPNNIEIRNRENNENEPETFLFLFETNKIEENFYGFGLKTIVRIISIFTLLISIIEFFDAFGNENFINLIFDLIISIILLTVTYYGFYSTIDLNVNKAYLAYLIYAILWVVLLIKYLVKSTLMIFGYIIIYENDFFRLGTICYILIEAFILVMYLYFVWIFFCYYVNMKRGNIQ